MSRVSEIGDAVLAAQRRLGLQNPRYQVMGMTPTEIERSSLFRDLPPRSELHDLYEWRNGTSREGIPIGKLWIRPGFYLLSANEAVVENAYARNKLDDWRDSWYPILSNGAGSRYFCDVCKFTGSQVPLFYFDPESTPEWGKIYDSIELMLSALAACYEKDIYFIGQDGRLCTDFPREVEASRRLNPNSDYWRRGDLFKGQVE